MRRSLIVLVSLFAIPAANAAGPWLGTAPAAGGYTAQVRGDTTSILGPRGTVTIDGTWGLPRVTLNGTVGGLSTDGRTLVLSQRFQPTGELRSSSAFAVLGTQPLRLIRTVELHGDFGYDALSPDGRTLYLVEHASAADVSRYRVRAYDVRSGRLVARVIADKRQRDWLMTGYPVARATSASGRWVYTLYTNSDNYPFVHALDTMNRTAVCIGLPWDWTDGQQAITNAKLRVDGNRLMIGGRFALDTKTFRVTKI